jgi:asparagine synthase (glutamine-hydrolysing)
MCRIAGLVCSVERPGLEQELNAMLAAIVRGGPDDEGAFVEGAVAFGHRRLSIIDISAAGHQPMLAKDSRLVISFNGEIYNYMTLRKEMELGGASFRTKTDTEVILHAYLRWGPSSFDKLEGMFAFSLYDKDQKKIFLVRDHVGVKPLYYFISNDELIFASEVKAFRALRKNWPENGDWKVLFLGFGSIPHPATTLDGVVQLSPGSYLEISLSDWSHKVKVFSKTDLIDPTIFNKDEALKFMQFAVRASVRKNLIADVPVGVYLSGGIDSSLLTLISDQFQKGIKTVSVNFDEASFDEYPYQKMVLEKTLNVEHTSHRISEQMFWESLGDIWCAMDQPSIDAVNTYFISKAAKGDGLKAVLSGVGADEVFGGYSSFSRIRWLRALRLSPFKPFVSHALGLLRKAYRRLIYLSIEGPVGDYLFLRGIHTPDIIARLLSISEDEVWKILKKVKVDIPENILPSEYVSYLESRIYMTNQLLKDTDFMSMWHGLEVRVPFLDIELLRKMRMIGPAYRQSKDWPKFLLTASNQNVIPREIIFRAKKGFTFPFGLWLKKYPKRLKALLSDGAATDKLVAEFENGSLHWSKVWSLAVLQQFKLKN